MGILRRGKEGQAPAGSRRTAAVPGYRQDAADERRRRLEDAFLLYAPRVFDYAHHRGCSAAEAEDLVSEVFMVLVRRFEDSPLDPDEVLPWLFAVARKVLANQLRGSRRRDALVERSGEVALLASDGAWDGSTPAVRAMIMREALARLREKDREALLLVVWEGFQYDEAAVILGCSPGAVAQRISRAREALLEEIGVIRTYTPVVGTKLSPVETRDE